MTIFLAIVQLFTLLALVWYAWETRILRMHEDPSYKRPVSMGGATFARSISLSPEYMTPDGAQTSVFGDSEANSR